MQLCPDALVSPTGESFVDAVPVPVFGRQQSPLRVDSGRGQDRTLRGMAPVECAIDGWS